MRKDLLLFFLTVLGSLAVWLPFSTYLNPGIPDWLPLGIDILLPCLALLLLPKRGRYLLVFCVGCPLCTLVGWFVGDEFWPPADADAAAATAIIYPAVTAILMIVLLLLGWIRLKIPSPPQSCHRLAWGLIGGCLALGPFLLAIAKPIIAHTIAKNDVLAEKRFEALRKSALLTIAQTGHPNLVCNASVLQKYYSGPTLSQKEWRALPGNYIFKDGYAFGIWCGQDDHYVIDVSPTYSPAYNHLQGNKHLCTDETGRRGTKVERNPCLVTCEP